VRSIESRRLALTVLPSGVVSTVVLPIPLYTGAQYETMVFRTWEADWAEADCERYWTVQAALAGHEEIVARWMRPRGSDGV
jgi:hypothetical protein